MITSLGPSSPETPIPPNSWENPPLLMTGVFDGSTTIFVTPGADSAVSVIRPITATHIEETIEAPTQTSNREPTESTTSISAGSASFLSIKPTISSPSPTSTPGPTNVVLSVGAKAGIGVGTKIGVTLLVLGAFFLGKSARWSQKGSDPDTQAHFDDGMEKSELQGSELRRHEVDPEIDSKPIYEAPSGYPTKNPARETLQRHELGGSSPHPMDARGSETPGDESRGGN